MNLKTQKVAPYAAAGLCNFYMESDYILGAIKLQDIKKISPEQPYGRLRVVLSKVERQTL